MTGPAGELSVESEIEAPAGKSVVLVAAGIDELRVAFDGVEVFRGSAADVGGHLVTLDLRPFVEAAGGRGRLTLGARAEGRPALLASVRIGEGTRARAFVTGDGGFTLGDGRAPDVLAAGSLPPSPGTAVPVLPLGRRRPVPPTDAGYCSDELLVGHLDVAFDGPSRGTLRLARTAAELPSAPRRPYDAPGGRLQSLLCDAFRCVAIDPEEGRVAEVACSPSSSVDRPGTPLSASDPRIAELDARALDAARAAAQAYVATGPEPRTLEVARLRGVALALLHGHGESGTVRRTLALLAANARKAGEVRAVFPDDGEPPLPEPSEALASFVVVLRDYVLASGDVKGARDQWLAVDRQLSVLHQRTGARQLLDVPGAPRRTRLEPNVLYGAALDAAADLSRWLSRISAMRLDRKANALRAAMVRHLLHRPTGLLGDALLGDDLTAPRARGNLLASLWGALPGEDAAAVLARIPPVLPGDGDAAERELSLMAAEAWLRAGEIDRGLELLGGVAERPFDPSDAVAAYLLRTYVLGVRPLAPGFRRFELSPRLGTMTFAEGSAATPAGRIKVRVERADGGLRTTIEAPRGLRGAFRPARGSAVASLDGKPATAERDGSVALPEGARAVIVSR